MKQFIRSRWGAAAVFVAMLAIVALAIIEVRSGAIVIEEPVAVSLPTLDATIFPNQSTEFPVDITNNGPTAVDVRVGGEVFLNDPVGPWPGVTVEGPVGDFTIRPGESISVSLFVNTGNGVPVGTGTLDVSVIRPD